MRRERNVPIDAMRGLAVLAVLGYHIVLKGFRGGLLGVDVFFAISGFVITQVLLDEHARSSRLDLRRFWTRRLVRLWPPLVLTVVAGVVLISRYPSQGALGSYARSSLSALTYTKNLTAASHPGTNDVLGHTWSLAMEEQFYLVWPLLFLSIAAARRVWPVALATLALASAGSSLLMAGGAPTAQYPDTYYLPQSRLTGLALGALAAFAVHRGPDGLKAVLRRRETGLAAVALIAVAWVLLCRHMPYASYQRTLVRGSIPLADLGAAVLVGHLALAPAGGLGTALVRSRLAWVGAWSYSLYLVHLPLAAAVFSTSLGRHEAQLASIVVSVAGGLVLHRIAERPALRWAARLRPVAAT